MKTGKIKQLHATVLALALLCTMLGGVFLSGCGSQDGENGKSAYELAVENGYTGTELEWLASLAGEAGTAGADGESAYELAVKNGYKGRVLRAKRVKPALMVSPPMKLLLKMVSRAPWMSGWLL